MTDEFNFRVAETHPAYGSCHYHMSHFSLYISVFYLQLLLSISIYYKMKINRSKNTLR